MKTKIRHIGMLFTMLVGAFLLSVLWPATRAEAEEATYDANDIGSWPSISYVTIDTGTKVITITYSGGLDRYFLKNFNGYTIIAPDEGSVLSIDLENCTDITVQGCVYRAYANCTITEVQSTGKIYNNYGTIAVNKGEARSNFGTITDNQGNVYCNMSGGTVTTMSAGTMNHNYGTITTAKGTSVITTNKLGGKIDTMLDSSIVTTNDGTIVEMAGGSEVTTNNGQIGAMDGSAQVGTNAAAGVINNVFNVAAFINSNDGIVKKNKGRIYYNNGRVEWNDYGIYDNFGIVAKNSGSIIINKTTGKVYQNTGTVLTDNGYSTTGPEPVAGSGDFGDIGAVEEEMVDLSKKIASGEIKGEQTVKLIYDEALPAFFMKTLKECEGVILDLTIVYMGTEYHMTIKGGKNLEIDESIPWYGPLYLYAHYGKTAGAKLENGIYTVVKGDTMSRIARKFGTTVKELLAKNPAIKNPDFIRVGHQLNY